MAVAVNAVVGYLGQSVQEFEVTGGVLVKDLVEGIAADLGDDFANLGGDNLLSGNGGLERMGLFNVAQGDCLTGATGLEELLLAEMVLVAAEAPDG